MQDSKSWKNSYLPSTSKNSPLFVKRQLAQIPKNVENYNKYDFFIESLLKHWSESRIFIMNKYFNLRLSTEQVLANIFFCIFFLYLLLFFILKLEIRKKKCFSNIFSQCKLFTNGSTLHLGAKFTSSSKHILCTIL